MCGVGGRGSEVGGRSRLSKFFTLTNDGNGWRGVGLGENNLGNETTMNIFVLGNVGWRPNNFGREKVAGHFLRDENVASRKNCWFDVTLLT